MDVNPRKRNDSPTYNYDGIRHLLQFDSRVRSEVVANAMRRNSRPTQSSKFQKSLQYICFVVGLLMLASMTGASMAILEFVIFGGAYSQ